MAKLFTLSAVALALLGPSLAVAQTADDPFQGVVPAGGSMAVGTAYPPGRSWVASCTVAGNVSVTFRDGTTLIVPLSVGLNILPFAVVTVNSSGTTATCTYANLK